MSKRERMQPQAPPEVTGFEIFKEPQANKRKPPMKNFLEPNDQTFSQIRKRLSAMTLNVDYKRSADTFKPPPVFQERKNPPRRISSINSKDTEDRYQSELFKPNHLLYDSYSRKDRIHSRASFLSDENEYRQARKKLNMYKRASESEALLKLNENILTPRQNPELFSRQIKLRDKTDEHARSESPKSLKSTDSTGKIHLGLIETLDLNEKLNDVERIKERYSNDQFIHSLALYKLRGHDRCLYNDGLGSDHIPRGTRLMSPDSTNLDTRGSSRLSQESSTTINTILSPRHDIKFRMTHAGSNWVQDESHPDSMIRAQPKPYGAPRHIRKPFKKRKSVGFDMNHKEIVDPSPENLGPPPSRASKASSVKEPKSILKRNNNPEVPVVTETEQKSLELDTKNEEFLVNANYRWRFHLPRINSPLATVRHQPSIPFRKKMYHFGDGVSREFETVINRYGNCRQRSIIRDSSLNRDVSAMRS